MPVSPSTDTFLPTTAAEVAARGWDQPDVVFVSGDAYVDHPSFAAALLGRSLEAAGYKVAILSQPDWKSADAWRAMGPPRLFYAVSAGNMDSMINHYTANRKRRNTDAYSPGGEIELRPDRATNVYAQRCREAFRDVPVVVGGVEASLRRIAHYDWWSEKVRPSVLVSTKADLLGYGMGERTICEIARRLDAGEEVQDLRDMRGVAYLLGAKEELSEHFGADEETRALPSFLEVQTDKVAFANMTRALHHETNPLNARRLTQDHSGRTLVINPPELALEEAELDAAYDQPFTRRPHPAYAETVPAWEMIRDSVTIMRGCFGGCTFCSITLHQGREIQSRSETSILAEVRSMGQHPDFKGTLSDLGGPTANMYRMGCSKPEVEAVCRRLSCVHPTVCKLLDTDHGPTKALMTQSRQMPGIKRVHVASGVRMDLAGKDPEYLEDLAQHHVGGHLKVAPEHVSPSVLELMKIADSSVRIAITPDGPRGPARKLQRGAIFLASRTGLPIYTVTVGIAKAWKLRTWDEFLIPKPFTRALLRTGAPFRVPPDLDRDGIEAERLKIEAHMQEMTEDTDARFEELYGAAARFRGFVKT